MYDHLGVYSDWVEEARRQSGAVPNWTAGEATREQVRACLGFTHSAETAGEVVVERRWEDDGLIGEQLSWSVGYGPRTEAWFFRPKNRPGPLPAVLALHDHGGFKYWGKEKIARAEALPHPGVTGCWSHYGGRPWVNALAREGFAVLVHDTFLWGSRRFPLETMEKVIPEVTLVHPGEVGPEGVDIARYNLLAGHFEHIVEKYCRLLGTTMAGVVSHEDRIALNYLQAREEVDPTRVACLGLSGGGNRAALLMASAENLAAGAIVGLMSTYAGLLDHNVVTHTWMLFPGNWPGMGDWPDLAGSRAPAPLLVQYDQEDPLFTPEGMLAAHARLEALYSASGHPGAYTGQFYPGPHKFDLEMQAAAFKWLKEVM